jgi:hypothetical protein
VNIEQWMDEPNHLKNWLRHPIRTYKTWRFFRYLKIQLRQSFFKEMDKQMLYGEGRELKGINPSGEIWDEWVRCVHCYEEIELIKTSIDDVWVHISDGKSMCDRSENFMTAKNWAKPYPMPELKLTLHVVHSDPHFYGLNKFCNCPCAKCSIDSRCICEDCPCVDRHVEEVPDVN